MSRSALLHFTLAMVLVVVSALAVSGRNLPAGIGDPKGTPPTTKLALPSYCLAKHNVGKIVLGVTNYGVFGAGEGSIVGSNSSCFDGSMVPSCEYPKGSNAWYLYAASFWIGGVKGQDTLVSVGSDGWQRVREMQPDEAPFGDMLYRSIIDPSKPEYEGAVSEQDYVGIYTDTFVTGVPGIGNDVIDNRPHRPLNIEVTQRSYSWSYSYAEDFVLFDYTIKNIGNVVLKNIYMGLYVDADVGEANSQDGAQDDVCGFLFDMPSPEASSGGCRGFRDTVYIAWIADNDGDMSKLTPVPNVTGSRIVRTPQDSLNVSFNWWIGNVDARSDFGPQRKANFRDLQTGGSGTPEGDRNKYAFLSNGEFDYNQYYTARHILGEAPADDPWTPVPASLGVPFSGGFDTRYLLSFGPFTIDPGASLPLSFAYVGGMNFHTNINNFRDNLTPASYHPEEYEKNLTFYDTTGMIHHTLGENAMWASWIYDNPGVDTDGDGTKGKYRICYQESTLVRIDTVSTEPLELDTVWGFDKPDTIYYQGDNAPDFRGASPPPAPDKWVIPSVGKLTVRWNGLRSETTEDIFSHVADFEGYRVYLSRDDRSASYSVIESFDREDYNKFDYVPRKGFVLNDLPYTRQQLVALYGNGDPSWDPLQYTINNPYRQPGTGAVFYFAPQDFNQSQLGVNTRITKRFPDAPQPTILVADSIPDSLRSLYLTEDGYFKYYEYQLEIPNVLPTVPYYVNVTAFDFGSPQSGLASLETSVTVNPEVAYPAATVQQVAAQQLPVYIYPNPYRLDANYQGAGFEGRDKETRGFAPDRQRRIHFANLPASCTIRIYTLDGDLVRELTHNVDPADPLASHDSWDMITRNTQLVVSGIYYWTVETPQGDVQMGKLVIVM